jgi:hypothetical protein
MSRTTTAQRRAYYDKHFRNTMKREQPSHLRVPESIERVEFHAPCFQCGARGECRHRRSWAESNRESITA